MQKAAWMTAVWLVWAVASAQAQPAGGASSPTAAVEPPAAGTQTVARPEAGSSTSTEGQPSTEVEKSPSPGGKILAPKDAGAYDLMIRDLNEKVADLKEKIFRSKARLILLKETVLHGAISGSKAVLLHRNEMGSSFRLEQVLYSLDGAPIFQKSDQDGSLDEREEFEIFHGAIVPGNHNLSVYMVYRGHGYGIFSYLEGYVFKIRSSFAFTAEEGKVVRIKIVGFEKGGLTSDLKDRPSVRFDMELLKDEPAPAAAAGSQEKAPGP